MKRKKLTKTITASIMAVAIAVLGLVSVPDNVQAEETSPVKYQPVKYGVMRDCIGISAPECTLEDETGTNIGYLFAGWYKTADNTSPIKSSNDVTDATDDTIVYAKFIPSYLTGIACQVDKNDDADMRNLRVVSLIDSTNYKVAGFNVYGRYDKDPTGDIINDAEWTMYQYSSDAKNPNKAESTKIYSGLYEYDDDNKKTLRKPEYVFGEDATGFYFTTVSIIGIGEKTNNNTGVTYDFKDATMAVKPYWVTLDGTYVEGMGEFNRVNDYYNKVVNVSVNLKDAAAIAAGKLNITVPNSFSYSNVEVETGRVFAEMDSVISGNIIKCIGNVSNVANNEKPNEVYVNLRFTMNANATVTKGANVFSVEVPDNGFCNIDETFVEDVTAWDVKY